MTWSLPGLAFFIFTFANLFPRGIASHKWYKEKFPDYPASRKAVIPLLFEILNAGQSTYIFRMFQ